MESPILLVVDTLMLTVLIGGFVYVATSKKKSVAEYLVTGFFLSFLGIMIAVECLRVTNGLKFLINQIAVNWGGFLFGLVFTGMGIYLMVVTVRDNKPITIKALSLLALPAIFILTGVTLAVISCIS